MAAFMIVTVEVQDHRALVEEYAAIGVPLAKQYGGEIVIRGGGAEVLEGNFGHDAMVVITRWPSRDSIKAYWNSPEYQALIPVRQRVSEMRAVIIDDDLDLVAIEESDL
jgi:uncharacterized protein (DUF1330 family)